MTITEIKNNSVIEDRISSYFMFIVLLIYACIAMLPLWWIFKSSVVTTSELYAYPPRIIPAKWEFQNYVATLKVFKFWQYSFNTLSFVVPAVFGGTITAALCGYALARFRFRGKGVIFSLIVGSMLLPNMVTLIPQYLMFTRYLGWGQTYLPLIVPYFFGGGAFNIFLIMQFIRTIPKDLDEAALIDGAGYLRIFVEILLPAIKPAIIVVALFLFISMWNDLLQQTVYINTPDNFTVAIGLSMFRSGLKADWSKIMAATCLSFLPGLIIYLIGQKYFVQGIVMSGLKD